MDYLTALSLVIVGIGAAATLGFYAAYHVRRRNDRDAG